MEHCPVLFLIFNRPDTTKRVFDAIGKAKPRYLFVAADGPRKDCAGEAERCEETRKIIGLVDWDCEVKTLFHEENLGCKIAVSSAITWFFEQVEFGIILEDDCLPSDSFFTFCGELLERYAEDERIMMISGNNFQDGIKRGEASYYFTHIPHIWGWATWRRAWRMYDIDMSSFPGFVSSGAIKRVSNDVDIQGFWLTNFIATFEGHINTWDYQWVYAILSNEGLSICPQVNMVSNIGFGTASTHTRNAEDPCACVERHNIGEIPPHPESVSADLESEAYTYRVVYDVGFHSKRNWISRWRKLLRNRRKTSRRVEKFRSKTVGSY